LRGVLHYQSKFAFHAELGSFGCGAVDGAFGKTSQLRACLYNQRLLVGGVANGLAEFGGQRRHFAVDHLHSLALLLGQKRTRMDHARVRVFQQLCPLRRELKRITLVVNRFDLGKQARIQADTGVVLRQFWADFRVDRIEPVCGVG